MTDSQIRKALAKQRLKLGISYSVLIRETGVSLARLSRFFGGSSRTSVGFVNVNEADLMKLCESLRMRYTPRVVEPMAE